MLFRHVNRGADFGFAHDHASWVAWRVQHQHLRLRRDRFLHPIGVKAEIGIAVDDVGAAAGHREQVLVHHEVGIEKNRFVAGINGGKNGEKEAAGDAGGDEDFADVAADFS